MENITDTVLVRDLGFSDYTPIWQQMQTFTQNRHPATNDELWIVEHAPVFTQGQAGKPEHLLNPGSIDVVQTDRGGQITYHGPGQVVVYLLIDLKRKGIGIRPLIDAIEQSVIHLLEQYQIKANARADAPGVYVDGAKICSLGLRVKRGCSYHGLALNVDMDLTPFTQINPCGYKNLAVTQMRNHGVTENRATVAAKLIDCLTSELAYYQREVYSI